MNVRPKLGIPELLVIPVTSLGTVDALVALTVNRVHDEDAATG